MKGAQGKINSWQTQWVDKNSLHSSRWLYIVVVIELVAQVQGDMLGQTDVTLVSKGKHEICQKTPTQKMPRKPRFLVCLSCPPTVVDSELSPRCGLLLLLLLLFLLLLPLFLLLRVHPSTPPPRSTITTATLSVVCRRQASCASFSATCWGLCPFFRSARARETAWLLCITSLQPSG